jgi:hypothetical protein
VIQNRLNRSNTAVVDICGRDCKVNKHKLCPKNWRGLGIQVKCNCECHEKNGILDRLPRSASSLISQR